MSVTILRLNQKKKDGLRYRRFRFRFRCSYIYNKVWKTQIVMFVSLMYSDRCSCIYTWVNLNLKRTVSGKTPFLLTENHGFLKS